MCVGSVCTQPIKIHQVFFFYLLKSLSLSQIKPSVRVTSHGRRLLPRLLIDSFITDCTGQHSELLWVSCHQLFHHRGRSRQEWLLSDWGVLLLDVIMNIAVVIYSQYGLLWKELFLTDKKVFFTQPMKKFNQMVKCIQTHFVSVFFKWFISIFITACSSATLCKSHIEAQVYPGDQFNQENESCLFTLDFALSICPFVMFCSLTVSDLLEYSWLLSLFYSFP